VATAAFPMRSALRSRGPPDLIIKKPSGAEGGAVATAAFPGRTCGRDKGAGGGAGFVPPQARYAIYFLY
jgi:hypothetical protein